MVTTVHRPAASPQKKVVVSVRRLFRAEAPEYVVLVATVVFLVLFGLVMVLSSSFVDSALGYDGNFFAIFFRQTMWALIGLPLMLIVAQQPPIFFRRLAPTLFLGALLVQALVASSLGVTSGGNTNWISVAGLSGQPSEFLKVALVIWMAAILSERLDVVHDYRTLLRPLGIGVLIALVLVMLGQDLGTMSIMVMIAFGVVFLAGARLAHLGVVVGVIAVGLSFLAMWSPSRITRIMTWLSGCSPEDYEGTCWQIVHSTYALGSGGLLGVGLGNSRAKWSWLPAAETDFIFAIVGEELGLVGTTLVIVSFVILAISLAKLLKRQPDPFARLVTGGVMVWLIGQALVNIAVVLEVLPVLGIPLPFMSVGGSALVASLIAVGVVMAVNRKGVESVSDYYARRGVARP